MIVGGMRFPLPLRAVLHPVTEGGSPIIEFFLIRGSPAFRAFYQFGNTQRTAETARVYEARTSHFLHTRHGLGISHIRVHTQFRVCEPCPQVVGACFGVDFFSCDIIESSQAVSGNTETVGILTFGVFVDFGISFTVFPDIGKSVYFCRIRPPIGR